ncbi:MAG: hypothetical protein UEM79_09505 [Gemmiger sp.]|uniref:hypothetical protein n=2 Tax=Eubacteriales TaxID=186802 RepID=UPI002E7641FB|nr:hypothetical protein [Gemmiger sp.]MEE0099546.1 hypothetical protein [Gemmiger sp.]
MTTNSTSNRMPRLLAMLFLLLGLFCAAALPAHAEDDYNTTLDRLSRLQALAREFSSSRDDAPDPIVLTLSYTRTGDYNTTIWQLTAGVRDTEFESYVNSSDAELASLQSLNTVTLPTGEKIDFGHMLASMNLVYNGIPITGSWGGDCQQLAQQYYGQAQDAAGYAAAMRATFNIDDDGSLSKFGDQDLRADMDSVIVGSKVTQDTDLADALRSYYENLTEYDRAKEFISLSFGTQDTSNSSFADAVYRALLDDSGMQLLFYMNGMWSVNGWQIKEDYAPAVRGAADLFAEYLAGAVNHEKVKSETNDRLVAMGGQALSDALAALGDSDAAAAALAAANELADGTQSAVSSGSDAISAARDTLQTKFDVKIFQLILLIAAAAAAFMLVFSMVMFVVHRKEN